MITLATILLMGIHPAFQASQTSIQQGDYVTAERALRAGLKAQPDHVNARVNLANILVMKKDYVGALVQLRFALKADPTDAVAWSSRGNALVGLGRGQEAVESYLKAVEADPANPTPLINLGDLSLKFGEVEPAMRYYGMALTAAPFHPVAGAKLARLLALGEQIETARLLVAELAREWPSHPTVIEARIIVAEALIGAGEPQEAAWDLLELVDAIGPGHPRVHRGLGQAYQAMAGTHPELLPFSVREFERATAAEARMR